MVKQRNSTPVPCDDCGLVLGRKADLVRHKRLHAENKEALMHVCPYAGCKYKTLQRSNLRTHVNVHTRERPNKCPTDGCNFVTADPGSLTRHRRDAHDYQPRGNSESRPSAITRKEARQRRRISPYSTSSSASSGNLKRSVSPLGPYPGMYRFPQMPDLCPPSSLLPFEDQKNTKNTSAAYSTELIAQFPQLNDRSHRTPNADAVSTPPLASGSSTTFDASTVYSQLPMVQHGNVFAADVSIPTASEALPEVSDEIYNDFLSQLFEWQNQGGVSYSAPPVPAPATQYTIGDALLSTSLSSHQPAIQYTANNQPAFAPTSISPYEYAVANATYGYDFLAQMASFDPQYSQPYSFVAPDVGQYPQVLADPCYFYPAPAAQSVLPMHGLYSS